MGPKRFVLWPLSVDDDTEFRSRCEWIIPFFALKYNIFPINLLKKNRGGLSPRADTPGWWGWKLCSDSDHGWMPLTCNMTVGLVIPRDWSSRHPPSPRAQGFKYQALVLGIDWFDYWAFGLDYQALW
jgi:hypothetical protein